MGMRHYGLMMVAMGGALVFPSASLFAHPGHVHGIESSELASGLLHPWLGLDHVLAMVAVGVLAVRAGGRSVWLVPLAFVVSMFFGGIAAVNGLSLPGIEIGVVASVLALGLLISMSRDLPAQVAVATSLLFAWFHGQAHGAEALQVASFAAYSAGFLMATSALLLIGVAAGFWLQSLRSSAGFRVAGGAITAAGLLVIASLF